jgi:glyoxylase-like metal-dependent hydrolase (beta-lactamase superfamily II)
VSGWIEVAEGVFQRRYHPLDVSVCVVRGADGLLVVDTRSSHREGDEIRRHLRELGNQPVLCVVNTHAHYDHSFGNAVFVPVRIYGHRRVPDHLWSYEEPMLADWIRRGVEPVDDWREVVITPPTELVDEYATLDIGGRAVELLHLGRGHTDNDLLVHVTDAPTWLVGDLVEESGPPMYGSGSFPLDWPVTAAAISARLETDAVVVPGHGAAVTPSFVASQQLDLQRVADLIRALHAAGVPEVDAVSEGGTAWPFPPAGLVRAVADGYRHLDAQAVA